MKWNNYQVFNSQHCTGNLAATIFSDQEPNYPELHSFCDQHSLPMCCYVRETPSRIYWVDWIGPKSKVRFCGHGALAVAAALDRNGQLSNSVRIDFESGSRWLHKESDNYWFRGEAPPQVQAVKNTTAYSDMEVVLNTRVHEYATYLDENGYLIAVVDDALDLGSIQPDIQRLTRNFSRSLILTTLQTPSKEYDFSFRYFAPRYGNVEDSATGSAAEILTSFWHQKLRRELYRIYQASPAGGHIKAKIEANLSDDWNLWIGGNVSPQTTNQPSVNQPPNSKN